ncbi:MULTISPECIES: response regulator transcription factor [Bacillaceae]|uniref:response regulator transcription factor n=1 Tax=Bacillaceae TaxID=186817 RepID=UPI001C5A56C5|nr:response regulator transcription factor [Rossellomorea sp. YZS02]MBW3110947.1 response regulator transcription factor [Bacillus sp. MCCB 382]MDX8344305.1 response regulator transcription factor [Rossellomorea sp. YZS02]
MNNILLIDDETRMLNLLELYLTPYDYSCVKKNNGYDAIHYMKQHPVDLIILDIMMPELNGFQTCEKIREFSHVPIIMLTARGEKDDIVKGLNVGADDYITKPFDEEELVARVNALFRRKKRYDQIEETQQLIRGGFTLDGHTYTLNYENQILSLTLKEYNILHSLMKNTDRVYTREQLLLMVWDINSKTDIRTVDSHIRNLRDKLKKAGFPIEDHLKTIWGIGYQWKI